jgi:hypothetical protein
MKLTYINIILKKMYNLLKVRKESDSLCIDNSGRAIGGPGEEGPNK